MNALIIYDEFASAAKASAALQHLAQVAEVTVQWNIRPWRVDMLKFPPVAEEALTEAIDAHLIVFAGRSVQSFLFGLRGWLEHWAKCRRIQDAALAVIRAGSTDALSTPATPELPHFAARHGLHLILDGDMARLPHHQPDGEEAVNIRTPNQNERHNTRRPLLNVLESFGKSQGLRDQVGPNNL